MEVKMTMEEYEDLKSKSDVLAMIKEMVKDCIIIHIENERKHFGVDYRKFYELYRKCGGKEI